MFKKKLKEKGETPESIGAKLNRLIVDFYKENRNSFLHIKLSRNEIIEWYWTTEIVNILFPTLKSFMNDELNYIYLLGAKISKIKEEEVIKELPDLDKEEAE